jgi:hypothetical protein
MNPSDLIAVFDEYLKKSGAGKNYIADKIFKLFDDKNSPFNIDGKLIENLKDNINDFGKKFKSFKLPNFYAFNRAMEGALKNVRNFRDNLDITGFSAFKIAMEGALKNVREFRDNLGITGFYAFDVAMQGALREVRTFRDSLKNINKSLSGGIGSLGTEAAVGTPTIVDVRLVDISQNAEDILSRIFSKLNIRNTTINQAQPKDKEEGSFIGKILKGILGTIALVAGIGFISSFLDTPMGKNIKAIIGNLKDRFVEMLKPFLKKIIDYSIEGLKVLFTELPKYFLKQTFNFFGLKEILGKENEGIAVLLTKGIYYGVKNAFVGMLNKFSFGGFSKLLKFIKPIIDFIPTTLGKLFSEIGDKLMSKIIAPLKLATKFISRASSMGTGILSKIENVFSSLSIIPKAIMKFFSNMGFGAGGGIGKIVGSITKLGGGSIFKLLGTMFKNIAKRIPFIGALISFKDAYDRIKGGDLIGGLVSIGSGIASFFPGIGTAISIGLDVLNMFLDKSASNPNSAVAKVKNFVSEIPSKIADTVGSIFDFFKQVLDMMNPLNWGKKIWNWVTGEKEDVSKELEKDTKKPEPKPIETNPVLVEQKRTTRWDMPQKVGDGIITKNKVVVPSSSDDVVMAKNGGPFDLAFREMNQKLENLLVIFAQGTELIANSTIQGSSSVVQAVVSTGGKQSPIMIGGSNPIADFRERANKSVG